MAAEGVGDAAFFRAPADGGVRRWQVAPGQSPAIYDGAGRHAIEAAPLSAGDILTNFGCRTISDRLWCDVRPFRGGARGFVPADVLRAAIGPDGAIALGVDDSKRRARRKRFDAVGEVPCAQERGQRLGRCEIGVSRGVGGDATAAVTFANGFSRLLYFAHGAFISANPTMSGTGTDTDWQLDGGVHVIRVDDQRFDVPDALLFGDARGRP